MYDKRLITFTKAAELKSISKAAQELYISSNAANKQILSLEEEWNVKLFNRTSKGVSLTYNGKFLYEYSLKIIHTSDEILNNISKRNKFNSLQVSEFIMGHPNNIYELCNKYSLSNNSLKILYIPYCDYTNFIPNLENQMNLCDCFIGPKLNQNKYDFTPLFTIPFICSIPFNNPLSNNHEISIDLLKEENVVIVDDAIYPDLKSLKKEFQNHCESILSSDDSFVRLEQICIIADPFHWYICYKNYIPLNSKTKLEIGIYTKKNHSEETIDFVSYLKENIQTY